MKPNNLIALLVVVILMAIGIALAIIHQREEDKAPKTAPDQVSYSIHTTGPVNKDANYQS